MDTIFSFHSMCSASERRLSVLRTSWISKKFQLWSFQLACGFTYTIGELRSFPLSPCGISEEYFKDFSREDMQEYSSRNSEGIALAKELGDSGFTF